MGCCVKYKTPCNNPLILCDTHSYPKVYKVFLPVQQKICLQRARLPLQFYLAYSNLTTGLNTLKMNFYFTSSLLSVEVHLTGRDVESAGPQIHSLPLVNEGQHENNTGPLWRTHSTQTKHHYPLVVRHGLWTECVDLMSLVLTIMWTCHGTVSWKFIQSYLQYKPSAYGKCNKGADVDEEDDNQIANPGHPTLGSILKKGEKNIHLYLFYCQMSLS